MSIFPPKNHLPKLKVSHIKGPRGGSVPRSMTLVDLWEGNRLQGFLTFPFPASQLPNTSGKSSGPKISKWMKISTRKSGAEFCVFRTSRGEVGSHQESKIAAYFAGYLEHPSRFPIFLPKTHSKLQPFHREIDLYVS